jgi:ATP-binding cassette subfamily C (CFTR/MRP) protein 4
MFSNLRKRSASKTDARLLVMNELIRGIRVIKMYAWDNAFFLKIMRARK